jgi:hypothetical protein
VHIGKTGGSYLKARLREASRIGPTKILTPRGHTMTLSRAIKQDPDTGILFAIRDPYTLFVSAFNSRQRKGQPRLYNEHTPGEAAAFARFLAPDELAVALGSVRPAVRREAKQAMESISHLRRAYSWYLKDIATLERHADHIVYILQTETLDDDLRDLRRRLDIPIQIPEAVTGLEKHAAPGGQSTDLSSRGRAALRLFWRAEFQLYGWTKGYREQILREPPRLQGVSVPPDADGGGTPA